MTIFDPRALIEVLSKHEVDYIIIGGVAVGVHGFERATKDLDIVPNPDPANLDKLATALKEVNAEQDVGDLEPAVDLDSEGLNLGGNFITLTDLGRLDVLQFQKEVDLYAMLVEKSIEATVSGKSVKVCGFEDLLHLKSDAGRPQDIIDIERIQRIREIQEENGQT